MGATFSSSLGERTALLGARASLISSAPAPPPTGVSIRRAALLRALQYRAHRFRHCRSLPLSLLSYAAFIATLLLHAKVSIAYDLQAAAAAAFVAGSGFSELGASAREWYAWVSDGFLPLLLPAVNGSAAASWASRPLNGYSVVVGGARLAQARSVAVGCAVDAGLRALYATPCYPSTQLSTAPFGALPADSIVTGAFSAGPGRGAEGGGRIPYAFELILDAQGTSLAAGRAAVAELEAHDWLDAATRSVTATAVLFNGQIATWATVRCTMDVQRGGRLSYGSKVDVFPADPYASPPDTLAEASDGSGGSDGTDVPGGLLVFLDLVVFLYFLYLARGTAHRVSVVLAGGEAEEGGVAKGALPLPPPPSPPPPAAARASSFVSRLPRACGYWLVLDYASLCSLLAMGVTWGLFVRGAAALRAEFAGLGAPAARKFASAAFAGTAARVMQCQEAWDDFKVAATLALICLSLRLFKYFKFQPRLAVMTDSLSMACSDGVHFAFLFAVMLVCYGTWGSFMFGHASLDWSNTSRSLMAVFRYMMYDYNLDAMSSSFPTMATVFYITMMLLLTNMVLWMFLAIVLESYTEVRARSHGAPSLFDDAVSAWVSLPRASALLYAASCGRYGEPAAGLADVIDALNGRLRDEEELSASTLAAGVPFLPRGVAEELILDASAWLASAEGGADQPSGSEAASGRRHAFWMPRSESGGAGGARASFSAVRAAVQRGASLLVEGAEAGSCDSGAGAVAGELRSRAEALSVLLARAGGDGGAPPEQLAPVELEELVGEAARLIAAAQIAKRGAKLPPKTGAK